MRDLGHTVISALAGAVLFLAPTGSFSGNPAAKLRLEKVYEYKKSFWWRGELKAVLDPVSHNLYVVEEGKDKAVVRVLDWQDRQEVTQLDFSHLPCNIPRHTDDWYRSIGPRYIEEWQFVPNTAYIHMRYCSSEYLLDRETFGVVRNLVGAPDQYVKTAFSPSGEYLAIAQYDLYEGHLSVYRIDPWEEVLQTSTGNVQPLFTSDGKYLLVLSEYFTPDRDYPTIYRRRVSCEGILYETATWSQAHRWVSEDKEKPCPGERILVIPGTEYEVVGPDMIGGLAGYYGFGIVVWDAWTGGVRRIIHNQDLETHVPRVSPDGRFLVTGAWNDPQDRRWSRDFVIWDLRTRDIAYQTPKYSSVWGSRTHGREVYTSFSYDGKYLIVVKERSVELHRVTLNTGTQ